MAQYMAANWWYGVLIAGVIVVAAAALRHLAREQDTDKCKEDCYVNAEEYCDCGGRPFVPEWNNR